MQSYHGVIVTPKDAIILVDAALKKMIPQVTRRLTEFERQTQIGHGSVFVWDEKESGMKRWTDGRSWSASRVSGSFLTYKEMENAKSGNSNSYIYGKQSESYRYKDNGLLKQSFSVTLKNGKKLHLISYVYATYLKTLSGPNSSNKSVSSNPMSNSVGTLSGSSSDMTQDGLLKRPSEDDRFQSLDLNSDLYPETVLNETYTLQYPPSSPISSTTSANSGGVSKPKKSKRVASRITDERVISVPKSPSPVSSSTTPSTTAFSTMGGGASSVGSHLSTGTAGVLRFPPQNQMMMNHQVITLPALHTPASTLPAYKVPRSYLDDPTPKNTFLLPRSHSITPIPYVQQQQQQYFPPQQPMQHLAPPVRAPGYVSHEDGRALSALDRAFC
ncbi:Transcriptional regulator MIT1 [Komagataella phaffii CBS 7435]|uniref:cAMP-independent regulatory protein n=2 Tax=Komagataella phaffii TaxID=460519 RepID=C4R402_KOMPG|nr:uncharacterized protein PAS_chr3_0251 [Komagataella phaffii GS115]AOA63272.1 GQ67_03302T0 [Komagataella phaffii]CAH2449970.1 Transcriptional regulator MIT1 [Komagataella phaffii CBS 7435]AOA68704.1 GQ68_03271T0 [Komagataella phaffii GS115]CAY70286.1 Putative protein with sequence similarity to S. pombe gti1+ (gluconate transport inducer 1) [Komagataella phaffii GS115]CCA39917.1 Transcriptional regulator MIT1 [Komagataella phaffii CBS 7435]